MEIFSYLLFMFLSVLGGAPPVLKTSTTRKNSGSLLSWTLVKGHAVLVPCLSVCPCLRFESDYLRVPGFCCVLCERTDSRMEGKDWFPCGGKEGPIPVWREGDPCEGSSTGYRVPVWNFFKRHPYMRWLMLTAGKGFHILTLLYSEAVFPEEVHGTVLEAFSRVQVWNLPVYSSNVISAWLRLSRNI